MTTESRLPTKWTDSLRIRPAILLLPKARAVGHYETAAVRVGEMINLMRESKPAVQSLAARSLRQKPHWFGATFSTCVFPISACHRVAAKKPGGQ